MPDSQASTLLILLYSCAGLLVVLLFLALRISRRLARVEKLIGQPACSAESGGQAPSAVETSTGGAFEAFLSEDPDRRNLPKSEQFSAYRQWRHEKGLNWSNS